jgi:hypothetical protein
VTVQAKEFKIQFVLDELADVVPWGKGDEAISLDRQLALIDGIYIAPPWTGGMPARLILVISGVGPGLPSGVLVML